ncbi:MAG: DUF3376 domain-containing protein [Gemmatimonadota bacterium]|nr:DUF3376 domain-containing protein [Gemmatimonadota bacterium]
MTKIALVLGGGVSLGSYIAGTVTEILRALASGGPAGPVRLQVITGTSAGALNAALAARALTVNPGVAPWLEKAWVDGADAAWLLNPGRRARAGVLDPTVLEDLTRALIAGGPASDDAPSSAVGDPLRVGVTLASLHGVRYDFRYGFLNDPERAFGTRRYADAMDFEIRPGAAADPAWERLREAALASAAFPFAFPPRRILRRQDEYPGGRLPGGAGRETEMWYVDGGLFDATPLGLAKDLVERDAAHRGADWRYVLVEPTLRASGDGRSTRAGAPESVAALAADLTRAVLGQSAAQDWIRANRMNARLEILHALLERLPEMDDRLTDPDDVVLGRYVGDLAERVAEMHVAAAPTGGGERGADPVVDVLDRDIERIEADPRYADVLASAGSRPGRSRLAKLIYVLESASGLRDKDVLPLYLVAPSSDDELAGDYLGGFGGFLHREWRAHDFRAGRSDARRLLSGGLAEVFPSYRPGPDPEYEVEPVEPTWASVPGDAKRRLEGALAAEAERLVAEVRPGPVGAAFAWAWKPVVRRWLAQRALQAIASAS